MDLWLWVGCVTCCTLVCCWHRQFITVGFDKMPIDFTLNFSLSEVVISPDLWLWTFAVSSAHGPLTVSRSYHLLYTCLLLSWILYNCRLWLNANTLFIFTFSSSDVISPDLWLWTFAVSSALGPLTVSQLYHLLYTFCCWHGYFITVGFDWMPMDYLFSLSVRQRW